MMMACAYCGQLKHWPDDFPVRHFARCHDCYIGDAAGAQAVTTSEQAHSGWWEER